MGKKKNKGDFQKVKLKVGGRKLPKNLNETKINLQTRRIQVREQVLLSCSEVTGRDEIRVIMRKLRASQLDERMAGVDKLTQFVVKQDRVDELISLNDFVRDVAPLLRDVATPSLRAKALILLESLVSKLNHLSFYHPAFIHCLSTTWNHLDENINQDSLKIFNILLKECPQCLSEQRLEILTYLIRLYQRITKSTVLKDAKQKIEILHTFSKFIDTVLLSNSTKKTFDRHETVTDIDSFDARQSIRDKFLFSWNSNVNVQTDVSLLENQAETETNFLQSMFNLLLDCSSSEKWNGLTADEATHQRVKILFWSLQRIVQLHFTKDHQHNDYSTSKSCNFCFKNFKTFFEKYNIINNFPITATPSQRKTQNTSATKEINFLLIQTLLCTPCLIRFLPTSFSKQVYAFLSDYYSGKLGDAELGGWLVLLAPLLTEFSHLVDNLVVQLFAAFLLDAAKHLSTSSHHFVQLVEVLVSAAVLRLSITRSQINTSSTILQPFLFLPTFLLQSFDSLKLHASTLPPSASTTAVAVSLLQSLIRLEASTFPGAKDVLIANSFRLIEHCPDQCWKRTLKIVVDNLK